MSDPVDVPVRLAADGSEVTLRELSGGQPMLVVLTRHMDCPYCEVHVGRVVKRRNELGRVIIVAHGEPEELREFYAFLPPEFVVVTDATLALYDAFATRNLSWVWGGMRVRLSSLFTAGLMHALRMRRWQRPGQDLLHLGGDAVIDTDGRMTYIHRAERSDDRPPVAVLGEQLHRAA